MTTRKTAVNVLAIGLTALLPASAVAMSWGPSMPGPPPTPDPIYVPPDIPTGACYLSRDDGSQECRNDTYQVGCRTFGSIPPFSEHEWEPYGRCTLPAAVLDDRIVVALEEPGRNSIVSGIGNLRGWAVGPDGVDYVWYYVNGAPPQAIPYGSRRNDVGIAFPDFPDSRDSGFSMAFNYGNLSGQNWIKVRAVSKAGKYNVATHFFDAISFHSPFIADPNDVSIDTSVCGPVSGEYQLWNVLIEGRVYDITLRWQKPAQLFHIVKILGRQDAASHDKEPVPCTDEAGIEFKCPAVRPATIDDGIVVALEEPVRNSVMSGIGNLRGWAVGPDGIDYVEYYMDGVLKATIPYGGRRNDVDALYPSFPGAEYSGFSLAYNYSILPIGPHSVTIRAVSKTGNHKEITSNFETIGFHVPFITNPDDVYIGASTCNPNSRAYELNDVLVEEEVYDIKLEWNKSAQQFRIVEINSQ